MTEPVPSLPEEVRAEQVRLLFANLPLALFFSVLVSLILAAVEADIPGSMLVLGWLLAILLVTAARAALAVSYRRAASDLARSAVWLRRFRVGALAAGLVWGAAGWWLFAPNDIAHQAFITAILVGMAAGAVSTLAVDRTSALSFILASLLPLTLRLLGGEFPLQLALGGLSVLLLIALSVSVSRIHRTLVENISLRLTAEPREQALRESALQLKTIIEAEPECVKQLAADGTLLQMNRAGLDMIEADSAEQVIGRGVTGIIAPASRKAFVALTKRVFEGGQGTLEFEIVGLKGSHRWLETHAVPLRDTQGRITSLLSVTRDITAHKAATEHIEHLAHHDALTDLPNRALLHERLTQALHLAQRQNEALAVMFLDLDRFKHVNDSLGHQVGDRLLVEVARRLQTCIRASDTLARIGGDEFVLVLADVTGANDTTHVVQKVFTVLQQPFLLEGRELTITPSIGISLFPDDGSNADELIRNADAAMYQAKEAGRSTFHFYTADMNVRAMDLLALEAALRRALERDELVLFYQPKIELTSGRMIGVEALIRWQHPEWGLVPPARFIPLAEETGLILPIGDWALREACRQTVAWRAQGRTLTMAVNLAARQFRQPDLVARVAAILAETGLDAAALELEITESAMMHNPQQVTETLIELKRIGVQIAIDDFGTGYSSLGYLKHFPVDVLKIDQTFIRDAPSNSHDAAIVRVIIDMARALKLHVVAEGVETAAHLAFVQNLGCDLAQGYHFAKPMPADELMRLV